MLAWADGAVAAYIDGGIEETRIEAWRWHSGGAARQHRRRIGRRRAGRSAGVDALRRDAVRARHRADARLAHAHVRAHRRLRPRRRRSRASSRTAYEQFRLYFLRTQRDEVDAIEAFGTFLWDIRFRDFDAEYALARITWDEARHTEIGHRALAIAGLRPVGAAEPPDVIDLPRADGAGVRDGGDQPLRRGRDPEDHLAAHRGGATGATTRWSRTSPTSSAPTSART